MVHELLLLALPRAGCSFEKISLSVKQKPGEVHAEVTLESWNELSSS